MIVFLIGFMGSGKTTIGKKLAHKLGFDFLDLDVEVEKHEQLTILQIFEQKGESYFRALEHQKLLTFLTQKKLVLSCGGGTPCFSNAIDLMNENGLTAYIQLSSEALFSRLKLSKETRPLLRNLNDEELRKYIQDKLQEREKVYLKSKLVIKGLSINIHNLSNTILKEIEP